MKYRAYDLVIECDFCLPLPEEDSSSVSDMKIKICKIASPNNLFKTYDGVWYGHGEDELYLKWDKIGTFLIREGSEILVWPDDSVDHDSPILAAPLLGTVMACALHQRGRIALHGSCIRHESCSFIFLGDKGEGKSTFASQFQHEGARLVSDDVCALSFASDGIGWVSPSFPTIKLWPDAMERIGVNAELHERVHPQFEKRRVRIEEGFADFAVDLTSIFVLSTGDKVIVERLSGHSAIPALVQNLVINRFPEDQTEELKVTVYYQLSKMINQIPIYKLTRPRDVSLLPELTRMVRQN